MPLSPLELLEHLPAVQLMAVGGFLEPIGTDEASQGRWRLRGDMTFQDLPRFKWPEIYALCLGEGELQSPYEKGISPATRRKRRKALFGYAANPRQRESQLASNLVDLEDLWAPRT